MRSQKHRAKKSNGFAQLRPSTNEIKRRWKRRLYDEQGGFCNHCKTHFLLEELTFDHIVPKSKGGGNGIRNRQLLCHGCNQAKADSMPGRS